MTEAIDVTKSDPSFDQMVARLRQSPTEVFRLYYKSLDHKIFYRVVQVATERAIAETGRGINLTGADLTGLNLAGIGLRMATLTRARLDSVDLTGANLTGAVMICPLMERTTLKGASLTGSYAHAMAAVSSDWSGADLTNALDTTGALFHGMTLARAKLKGGNYSGATFYQCDLTDADLRGCDLVGATFNECVLRGARLDRSNLTNASVIRSNADRISLDNAYGPGLTVHDLTGFTDASLSGAHLPDMTIRSTAIVSLNARDAKLPGLRLLGGMLASSDFDGADLSESYWRDIAGEANRFQRALLTSAAWTRCRLPHSDLSGAGMENARLLECAMPDSLFRAVKDDDGDSFFKGRGLTVRDCDLSRADFTAAYLYRASFTGDPVTGMRMDDVKFGCANLIQAYIAAALPGADLRAAQGAYSRFNQSDLTSADMTGMTLYQASFVKSVLSGAAMRNIRPPVFMDRCNGADDADMDDDLTAWRCSLASILVTRPTGST